MEYRILIVDDDAATRRRYAEALVAEPPAIGVSYKITAGSGAAAQLQASRQRYQLLVATIAHGGRILELVHRLQEMSPGIVPLLVSESGLDALTLQHAQKDGVHVHPNLSSGEQLRQLVSKVLGISRPADAVAAPSSDPTRPQATIGDLQLILDVLRRQTQSQLVIFADNVGNVIVQRGDEAGLELSSVTSLIAGSFVNSIEMGRLLRDPDTIHLSVHEGAYHDIYSTNVGSTRILALIFDKEFVSPKLGMIWLLLKRCAEQLRRMQIIERPVQEHLAHELSESLNSEFDRLFGNELLPTG